MRRIAPSVEHPMHPEHPLTLRVKRDYRCNLCQHVWKDFTYTCSQCDFDMDIVCASAMERKIDHPSHKRPLTPVRRKALLRCDACAKNMNARDTNAPLAAISGSIGHVLYCEAKLNLVITYTPSRSAMLCHLNILSLITFVAYVTSDRPEFIGLTIAENGGILPMSHVKRQISRLASASIHLGRNSKVLEHLRPSRSIQRVFGEGSEAPSPYLCLSIADASLSIADIFVSPVTIIDASFAPSSMPPSPNHFR
ncbi:hypothetical protein RJ640_029334 [Escallonia rubra]|uniref:DC1 domain-containing protein n=1 Tax=Escallonia rubra TaxID=112253 RepID=A0AA88RDM3_9ASTE|nr:hypothetical protein RJ640_029334 [Escallonia rubra]